LCFLSSSTCGIRCGLGCSGGSFGLLLLALGCGEFGFGIAFKCCGLDGIKLRKNQLASGCL
jgi:hypothetical protein